MVTARSSITVGGVAINYERSHVADEGAPTLFLLHGFGASLESWHDIYPELASRFSTIRIDLKGFGFSNKPDDRRYAPSDNAAIVNELIRAFGLKNVVLVGHSYGGAVALLTYLNRGPDAPVDRFAGLVLIDSAGYPQRLPFFVASYRHAITRRLGDLIPARIRVRLLLKQAFAVQGQVTPDRVARYAHFLGDPESSRSYRATAEQMVPADLAESILKFNTITLPTLILWGDRDPIIPVAHAYRFQHEISGSQLVVYPATGHVPHEERPSDVVRDLDRFVVSLGKQPSPQGLTKS